jgi:endonuclease/exonuclease/phosphatase family metal-dependent hydrolase
MRIASFNVQNLRLRPGPGGPRLDGARDRDHPQDLGPGARALDASDRRLTAAVLAIADADVVALQEVFDQATLDVFHDRVMLPAGVGPYPHRACRPGNDGRGFDLALMSRIGWEAVESHAADTPATLGVAPAPGMAPDARLFRRDCLVATIGGLTLFLCHFKAPWPDPVAARAVRRMEAEAVRRLVERQFADPAAGLWLVLGDLNEPVEPHHGADRAIAPLLGTFSVDLLSRLPEAERWTAPLPDDPAPGRPDALLASPALARAFPQAVPRIIRAGLDAQAGGGARLPGVGAHRPHASDHAALVVEFPGLGPSSG